MSGVMKSKYADENNEISVKYDTIEDYLNSKPLSTVEVEWTFNADQAELVFSKPIFDLAFILTHESLIKKIVNLQKHFQSKHALTTHCILLPDFSKLKFCIRDLKMHQITYAIIVYENSLTNNNMDLYILYPNIEIQKNMTLDETDKLLADDVLNITDQIKYLKKMPNKSPHPMNNKNEERFNMNDKYRYYFSLLSDCRMLSMPELKTIEQYLNQRKFQLEKALQSNPNLFEDSPLEACRMEPLKYFVYEEIRKDVATPMVDKRSFVQGPSVQQNNHELPTKIFSKDAVRPPIKFNLNISKIAPSISNLSSICKPMAKLNVQKAKIINCNMTVNVQKIKAIQSNNAIIKHFSYNIINENSTNFQIHQVKDSMNFDTIRYTKSNYSNVTSTAEMDVISLSSGCSSPQLEYELTPITPPSPSQSKAKLVKETLKRKLTDMEYPIERSPIPKVYVMDLSADKNNVDIASIKNIPESLVNMFKLILNMAPLALPHDNALVNILTGACNEVQNGIIVPALKNVQIDYDSCKTNGVKEIIESIYAVYDAPVKPMDNFSDMEYIWKHYFPDHLSNFNILILFYRFVKLLILYKLFNVKTECIKKVLGVLDKMNSIVNFDFNLSVNFDQKPLNCFPIIFVIFLEECDELHHKYSNLPNETSLQPLNNMKNLDDIIRKKKIEFIIGPLLNYFVNSINSIHQQMELVQIKKIYHALRTLRFCLRKIYPVNVVNQIFSAPKIFDNADNTNKYYKDITEELKWLLDEMKYYHCILFTELHYEFVNCILDFSFLVEEIINMKSDSFKPKTNVDGLVNLDQMQFISSFTSISLPVYQYHSDTEIEFLKGSLKDCWVHTLQYAFLGKSTDKNENRIIKEINNLLPSLWGLKTFDEAVMEAAKLYYTEWAKIAQSNSAGWFDKFSQNRYAGIIWLNLHHLPYTKAVEELQKYENMLKNEFLKN